MLKGVDFQVDPITPFYGDDKFSAISPLRRIPVFIDGDLVLNDSSVIAEYIEEVWPAPPALPEKPAARARARWFEEFSDSRIGDVFIWKGFAAKLVAPGVFGGDADDKAFDKNLQTDVVDVMAYLEKEMPEEGFIAGPFGVADISIAAMFRVMKYAGWSPDVGNWPKTCAWLERAETQPALQLTNKWSDALLTTPRKERREKASHLGLSLTPESFAERTPRRGPMTVIG